jgi:hypothetical protein
MKTISARFIRLGLHQYQMKQEPKQSLESVIAMGFLLEACTQSFKRCKEIVLL